MELPIVCTLTKDESSERNKTILASIREAVVDKRHCQGDRYAFIPDSRIRIEIHKMVELERQCCHFLTFDV